MSSNTFHQRKRLVFVIFVYAGRPHVAAANTDRAPITLSVYTKGFPPNGASNKGRSEKFSDFSALSVNISKTVADTAKVTISH